MYLYWNGSNPAHKMKRFVFLMLSLLIWTGCNTVESEGSLKFTDTGCSVGTRAGGDDDVLSLLTLKFEDGSLLVTRTNAEMNCSIKNGGIGCDVSFERDEIRYRVYENDGATANCTCLVERMSSVVTGLELGKTYTFLYSCGFSGWSYAPVTFTFEKNLFMVMDMESLQLY